VKKRTFTKLRISGIPGRTAGSSAQSGVLQGAGRNGPLVAASVIIPGKLLKNVANNPSAIQYESIIRLNPQVELLCRRLETGRREPAWTKTGRAGKIPFVLAEAGKNSRIAAASFPMLSPFVTAGPLTWRTACGAAWMPFQDIPSWRSTGNRPGHFFTENACMVPVQSKKKTGRHF